MAPSSYGQYSDSSYGQYSDEYIKWTSFKSKKPLFKTTFEKMYG
jgi:hypothetical protein